jgi:hypothetical protein
VSPRSSWAKSKAPQPSNPRRSSPTEQKRQRLLAGWREAAKDGPAEHRAYCLEMVATLESELTAKR